MTEISRELLLHVAHLTRLELRDDELARLETQLNDIIAAVSKVAELASHMTPVPGGVGPMTIAMLLRNAVAAKRRRAAGLVFPRN